MRWLGVDPGTIVTGYGVIESTGPSWRVRDHGIISPPSSQRLSQRYLLIHEGIQQLIHLYHPDGIAVETQYVAKNPSSAIKLGIARGMVILAAAQHQIPLFEYTPSRVKQAVTGNGRASKEQVQYMMLRLLNLAEAPKHFDVTDALAVALCHAHFHDHAALCGERL
jgi:crossover junction endodeoxyribonuclease RuvC